MDFCTIASGSSGNCTFTGTSETSVLIDVGLSGKRITEGLHQIDRTPEELSGILITHEHIDHIKGLGVYLRKYHIPVYATPGTIRAIFGSGQIGSVDPTLFHPVREDEPFSIGDLTIEPFSIRHDAAQPVGYRMSSGHVSVAVATDMGCYDEYIVEHLKNLDGLLLESNHDVNMLQVGPYPYPLKQRILGEKGHLSNEVAGRLLGEVLHDDIRMVLLGHLSKENNYAALALATVQSEIALGDNPYHVDDFDIRVADRESVSQLYEL